MNLKFACVIVAVFGLPALAQNNIDKDLVTLITQGVGNYYSKIKNIQLEYEITTDVINEEWKKTEVDNVKKNLTLNLLQEGAPQDIRIPTLEKTIRTGTSVYEGANYFIESNQKALSDNFTFYHSNNYRNAGKVTSLDRINKTGTVTANANSQQNDLTFSPLNIPNLFLEGSRLDEYMQNNDVEVMNIKREVCNNEDCLAIDMVYTFNKPDGLKQSVRKTCWVVPGKDYLIVKAIAYSVDNPSLPITVTDASLTQVGSGYWAYVGVEFKSYITGNQKPDRTMTLKCDNIQINKKIDPAVFEPDISLVTEIFDLDVEMTYPVMYNEQGLELLFEPNQSIQGRDDKQEILNRKIFLPSAKKALSQKQAYIYDLLKKKFVNIEGALYSDALYGNINKLGSAIVFWDDQLVTTTDVEISFKTKSGKNVKTGLYFHGLPIPESNELPCLIMLKYKDIVYQCEIHKIIEDGVFVSFNTFK